MPALVRGQGGLLPGPPAGAGGARWWLDLGVCATCRDLRTCNSDVPLTLCRRVPACPALQDASANRGGYIAEAKRVLAAAVHTASAQEAAVVESRCATRSLGRPCRACPSGRQDCGCLLLLVQSLPQRRPCASVGRRLWRSQASCLSVLSAAVCGCSNGAPWPLPATQHAPHCCAGHAT